MERNIKLLKFILPLSQLWFWNGIWLIYYLSKTNYKGVGIIEGIVFMEVFLLEIPTGAISDLLGKKKTLIFSYFFYGLGNLLMAFSDNLTHLIISVLLLGIGATLYSGTSDALIYDSLKTINKESIFDKILVKVQTYSLLLMAMASFIGGYFYSIDARLPFFATTVGAFIGLIICLFLQEPPIDSEKFSLKNYLKQTRQGFKQLFSINKNVLNFILEILVIYSFANILINVLDGALAIEFGFNEKQLGILFGLLPLVSAIGSHFYPEIKKYIKPKTQMVIIVLSLLLSAALSPLIGIIVFTFLLIYRSLIYPIINIIASDSVNANIESKYRATTISTFTMLYKLPYAITAYFIGDLIDKNSASNISLWLSVFFTVGIIVHWIIMHINKNSKTALELENK